MEYACCSASVIVIALSAPGIRALSKAGNATILSQVLSRDTGSTAHNEYAVQAFKADALDYLTKPVEPERLRATLVRVKERIA